MQPNHKFLEAEAKERFWLRSGSGPDTYTVLAESTAGTRTVYDAVCEFKGRKQMVEIKVRTKRYDTAYLEKSKVTRLITAYKEYKKQHTGLYLAYYAFYPEQQELYIIDLLDQAKTEALDVWCGKTTMGNTQKMHKDFYEYRLDDAWQICLKTGNVRPPLDPCDQKTAPNITFDI
jgi:Holliday junction resolvase